MSNIISSLVKNRLPKFVIFLTTLAALSSPWAINAQGFTVDLSSSTGTGTSQTDVLIQNIRVMIPIVNPFDQTSSTTSTATYNVTFRLDPNTLHLVPVTATNTSDTTSRCADLSVQVYNAVTGTAGPISGATVTVGSRSATTDSSGMATLTGVAAAGIASIAVAASNYTSVTQTATLVCGANTVAVAMSPSSGSGSLTSGQFRVILTWGQNPTDLDSHLTGPNSGTISDTNRWHVYYSNKTAGDMCGLDVDDTSSYGPETVTCPRTNTTGTTLREGVYRYSVHHYSGSSNIGSSGAAVRLEFADGTVYNYSPPTSSTYTGSGNVWTVFEITVNTNGTISVAPINTVTTVSSSSSVRRGQDVEGQFGRAEDASVFQGLTK